MKPADTAYSGHPAEALLEVVRDFSQYLSRFRDLGSPDIDVSTDAWDVMKGWKDLGKQPPEFHCQGSRQSRIVMVDSRGTFFTGESGALLKKMIAAMNLSPDKIFICDANTPDRVHDEIRVIKPQIIIALGQKAAALLLGEGHPLDKACGRFHQVMGIKVMPVFHPSRLIAEPDLKRREWEAMKQVMAYAGLE